MEQNVDTTSEQTLFLYTYIRRKQLKNKSNPTLYSSHPTHKIEPFSYENNRCDGCFENTTSFYENSLIGKYCKDCCRLERNDGRNGRPPIPFEDFEDFHSVDCCIE